MNLMKRYNFPQVSVLLGVKPVEKDNLLHCSQFKISSEPCYWALLLNCIYFVPRSHCLLKRQMSDVVWDSPHFIYSVLLLTYLWNRNASYRGLGHSNIWVIGMWDRTGWMLEKRDCNKTNCVVLSSETHDKFLVASF